MFNIYVNIKIFEGVRLHGWIFGPGFSLKMKYKISGLDIKGTVGVFQVTLYEKMEMLDSHRHP